MKQAATRAAKEQENLARYMGDIQIQMLNVEAAELHDLTGSNDVDEPVEVVVQPKKAPMNTQGKAMRVKKTEVPLVVKMETPKHSFDEYGEFSTPINQIPLSRISYKKAKHFAGGDAAKNLLDAMYSLQCPDSSPWKLPFIRLATSHTYDAHFQTLAITFHVYFTRLIFELISDPSVKTVSTHLQNVPATITPVQKLATSPPLFRSSNMDLYDQLPGYRYSLAGILKHAESQGYPLAKGQPPQLKVKLFDYQLSTYQW